MTKKVVTRVNGQAYEEELSFEELSKWSAGRWQAGQGEASDNVMARAAALVKVTQGKEVVRDEGTGELIIVDSMEPPPAAPSTSTDEKKTAEQIRKENEEKLKAK